MLILAVDTSTSSGSAAILENRTILGEVFLQLKTTHSERVLTTIDSLLKFLDIDISDINLFVSSIGPGSFTGIRIGLSLIKGFGSTAKKPIIGVSSLDALAMEFRKEGKFCSFIEGRKNEVFYCEYIRDNDRIEKISDYKCEDRSIIKNFEKSIGIFNNEDFFNSSNKGMLLAHNFAFIGFDKYVATDNKEDFLNYKVTPLYLKKSDAEINSK
jgi:tRNA threonylcarbamoyl adenosine modification protein YeaZ